MTMPKKKKSTTKKIKPTKVRKPRKETKQQKAKAEKLVKFPANQLENLDKWLSYYKEHKKFPHNRIICSHCKEAFVSLKGIGMSWAMKAFKNDVNRILTESLCKVCKEVLSPKEEKEKAPKVVHIETPEEREARYDEIRKTIPKIDLYRVREPINLVKDKEACKKHTYFACNNPQVYLDYGCNECSLQKHCACPIKDLSRIADGRGKKKKK
jgi:hypothetical protein